MSLDSARPDLMGPLVVVFDREGRIVRWNAACSQLTGFSPNVARGKHVSDLFPSPPEEAEPPSRSAGVPRSYEDCWTTRSGERRWFAWVTVTAPEASDGAPPLVTATGVEITERKRREDELRRSEELFRLLVSNAEEYAIYILDPNGRVASWNVGAERIIGYRAGEILSQDHSVFFPPADVALGKPQALLREAASKGQIRTEGWRVRKDGSQLWASVTLAVLRAEATGSLLGYAQIVRDDSARKATEDALRASEQKFAGIVSIAGDAIISTDDDLRIVIFNEAAERIFGYSREEVLGKELFTLSPERLKDTHRRYLFDLVDRTMRPIVSGERAEIVKRRKSGEEFPAEIAVSRLERGERAFLSIVLRDVTEQRRSEDDQRFLQDAWSTLLGSLDYEETLTSIATLAVGTLADVCTVYVFEPDGHVRRSRVITADPTKRGAAEALQRIPIEHDDPYGARVIEAFGRPNLMADATEEDIRSYAQNEEHVRLWHELNLRSAVTVPLLARGRLVGGLVFFATKPGRYGQRELRLVEELGRRAGLAVDNAKLYQTARQAIRARDDVLGIVAHDLRNYLSALILNASLLKQKLAHGEDGVERRDLVDRELRVASRMNRLILDLLDLSAIESGQLTLRRAPHGVSQLVDEVLESVRPGIAAHTIIVEVPTDLPTLDIDCERVIQVFSNLVNNAAKFTPPGGAITLGGSRKGDQVCFWVTDTGVGIDEKDLPHVFDRFWTAAGKNPGTGLGLPICKGIVEGHGGHIWVESKYGAGSTFFFSLPSVTSPEEALTVT